ncbi:MAG: S8 family peptidase, partial [Pseudomonadota bacterium]
MASESKRKTSHSKKNKKKKKKNGDGGIPGGSFELKDLHETHVIVRFHKFVPVPYEEKAEQYLKEFAGDAWKSLSKDFPGISLSPLFTAANPEKLQGLIDRAREVDRTYSPGHFFGYFRVRAPMMTDLDALAKRLSSWEIVDTAYVDRPGPDPVVNAADDPRSPNQGYLDPAPDGIDAEYAWGFTGGDGAGQRFIDLERGWTLNHEDLNAQGATLLHGTIRDNSRSHGTSVLGQVCAVDNTIGCVGIAPNIASVDVVSFFGSTRPDAILAAITNLSFGDVLLIEAQAWADFSILLLGPIEINDADFDALRLATALGIIVVEAGGNGTDNGDPPPMAMDTWTNSAGLQILNPASADFRDSGAIIVSAATSTSPHTRLDYAPHGERIDCYAWGQNIDTCASSAAGSTTNYTTGFGGTSGASPIITGAALLVQGLAEAGLGYRFSPKQMRALLRNPANGTPPAATETTQIGVMPDLRAIIDGSDINLAHDVYIRDNVGDTGDPHSGSISASPDIILLPSTAADPQASFGQGSGTENNNALGFEAVAGQDNHLYARLRNRGGSNAANVDATIFWSPVSTLVTPDLWTLVGSTTLPNVPMGDQLTVSSAITWPQAEIPGPGHYCFVGLVGTAQDPAPGPADFLNFDNFRTFIRENNNVTWRNFNVVPSAPAGPDPEAPVVVDFLAPGA